MKQKSELTIPESAVRDVEAFEILRLWIAGGEQHVSLRSGVWDDPAAWGIMLADLARHVARSYHAHSGFDELKTLQRIKAGLDAEFTDPTDNVGGRFAS